MKRAKPKAGELKRKLAILLLGGFALSLSRSPKQQFEILNEMIEDWQGVRKSNIKRGIKSLSKDRLLTERHNSDGTVQIVLNEEGRRLAKFYTLDDLKIGIPKKWDGNWRIVTFDVPEKRKVVRESLRMHLRDLGFSELQKSIFVHPFHCLEEVDQIVHFYNASDYVRLIVAYTIDNEEQLKQRFDL